MIVFIGARVFDGARFYDDSALVVENGRVQAIVAYKDRPHGDTRDLGGGALVPGFVDWQVNGGGGAHFNAAPIPQTIAAIVAAHRRFGTTALLPTVITDAPTTLAAALEAASTAIPGSLGIHVEGPYIDVRRKGAHPERFIRVMSDQDEKQLIDARATVVTVAPASVTTTQIARLAASGIVVSIGHAEATTEEAQGCFDAGARAVTHLFNAMSQLGHRAPGLAGAALADSRVTAGFIADGFHVHETAGRVAYAAKGAHRLALVSDAMPSAAGGPPTYQLDGREVRQEGLKLTLADGTLAGAAITMLDAVRYAVETLRIPLTDALAMATSTPARLLRVEAEHGTLAHGAWANLVHLGTDLRLHRVWFRGQIVG